MWGLHCVEPRHLHYFSFFSRVDQKKERLDRLIFHSECLFSQIVVLVN